MVQLRPLHQVDYPPVVICPARSAKWEVSAVLSLPASEFSEQPFIEDGSFEGMGLGYHDTRPRSVSQPRLHPGWTRSFAMDNSFPLVDLPQIVLDGRPLPSDGFVNFPLGQIGRQRTSSRDGGSASGNQSSSNVASSTVPVPGFNVSLFEDRGTQAASAGRSNHSDVRPAIFKHFRVTTLSNKTRQSELLAGDDASDRGRKLLVDAVKKSFAAISDAMSAQVAATSLQNEAIQKIPGLVAMANEKVEDMVTMIEDRRNRAYLNLHNDGLRGRTDGMAEQFKGLIEDLDQIPLGANAEEVAEKLADWIRALKRTSLHSRIGQFDLDCPAL